MWYQVNRRGQATDRREALDEQRIYEQSTRNVFECESGFGIFLLARIRLWRLSQAQHDEFMLAARLLVPRESFSFYWYRSVYYPCKRWRNQSSMWLVRWESVHAILVLGQSKSVWIKIIYSSFPFAIYSILVFLLALLLYFIFSVYSYYWYIGENCLLYAYIMFIGVGSKVVRKYLPCMNNNICWHEICIYSPRWMDMSWESSRPSVMKFMQAAIFRVWARTALFWVQLKCFGGSGRAGRCM